MSGVLDARIAYVSATGPTTVPGLAYAGRLGLWGSDETPFEKRTEFASAMEAAGVAAMEVVARDLKALGLYQARALAYAHSARPSLPCGRPPQTQAAGSRSHVAIPHWYGHPAPGADDFRAAERSSAMRRSSHDRPPAPHSTGPTLPCPFSGPTLPRPWPARSAATVPYDTNGAGSRSPGSGSGA